ncbi:MAG: right-handed parallel beta-helix repeat-containing protein, partial [Planctomycetota bacterium]
MKKRKNLNIGLAVCLFLAVLACPAAGRIIYVNPNGSADFTTIQAAIDDANNSDQIEVAPGIYEAINFKGKAIRLYSRDGSDVTTIDGGGYQQVVRCITGEDANTILEGFTITGGYAYDPLEPFLSSGGGMYNSQSSPTVTDCNFTGNSAGEYGGGMFNTGASPTVTNCTFSDNTASRGGGMFNTNSSPTVTNCNFTGNSGYNYGGGIFNRFSSSPTVTDCTFSDNTASRGGGMYNDSSSPTVTDCNFTGNSGDNYGGGMRNTFDSNSVVTNCKFSGNTSEVGGGMSNTSNPTVTNCAFSNNSASISGGGMSNTSDGSPTVTNCTFSGNTANVFGGGMANFPGSPTVTNCTFSGNSAAFDGGGMWNDEAESDTTLTNCILWGDTPDEIFDEAGGIVIVSYSNVEGGWSGPGGNNIEADPCFVDADNPDPNLWNLRLMPDSPCIDKGDNNALPAGITTDLDGNPRIVDGNSDGNPVVDMGAYEWKPPVKITYVDAVADGNDDGTSWKDAFNHLQDVLPATVAPCIVRVAQGTY